MDYEIKCRKSRNFLPISGPLRHIWHCKEAVETLSCKKKSYTSTGQKRADIALFIFCNHQKICRCEQKNISRKVKMMTFIVHFYYLLKSLFFYTITFLLWFSWGTKMHLFKLEILAFSFYYNSFRTTTFKRLKFLYILHTPVCCFSRISLKIHN